MCKAVLGRLSMYTIFCALWRLVICCFVTYSQGRPWRTLPPARLQFKISRSYVAIF